MAERFTWRGKDGRAAFCDVSPQGLARAAEQLARWEELLASLTPQNFSVKGLVPYGLTQGHAQKVDKYIWKFHVRCATRLQCRIH